MLLSSVYPPPPPLPLPRPLVSPPHNLKGMADCADDVCSMCGDVGFSDKLFRCLRCRSRFQHSYCTNYYSEDEASQSARVCDWCLSERNELLMLAKKTTATDSAEPVVAAVRRSPYLHAVKGDKVKQSGKGGEIQGSSKTSGRRYKLLKDVLR